MRFVKKNKRSWLILICLGMAALICDFLIPSGEEEHGFWWTHFPGFDALLGFVGCLALVYLAKWLGHYWLQKKEDYYD